MDPRNITDADLDALLAPLTDDYSPVPMAAVTTPAIASVPTVYEFPSAGWESLAGNDDHALKDELDELLLGCKHGGAARHALHRERICHLHLALNRRRAIAPRFRPEVRPNHKITPGTFDELLSRDRQVVDLHWLFENGHEREIENRNEFRNLFTESDFDFDIAGRFACAGWRRETKFLALGVTDAQAAELATYQPEAFRTAWKTIETKKHHWHTQLLNRGPRNLRQHFPSWIDVRAGIELIGPDTPAHQLARLVALMTGSDPTDDRGMSRKRNSVLQHLPIGCGKSPVR